MLMRQNVNNDVILKSAQAFRKPLIRFIAAVPYTTAFRVLFSQVTHYVVNFTVGVTLYSTYDKYRVNFLPHYII